MTMLAGRAFVETSLVHSLAEGVAQQTATFVALVSACATVSEWAAEPPICPWHVELVRATFCVGPLFMAASPPAHIIANAGCAARRCRRQARRDAA